MKNYDTIRKIPAWPAPWLLEWRWAPYMAQMSEVVLTVGTMVDRGYRVELGSDIIVPGYTTTDSPVADAERQSRWIAERRDAAMDAICQKAIEGSIDLIAYRVIGSTAVSRRTCRHAIFVHDYRIYMMGGFRTVTNLSTIYTSEV